MDEARELIEEAMAGVRIIVCQRCNGLGEVGLVSLRATCPVCHGSGETVADHDVIFAPPGNEPVATRREAVLALIQNAEEAARFLKIVGYSHGEIVDALIKQYRLTQDEAEALASA